MRKQIFIIWLLTVASAFSTGTQASGEEGKRSAEQLLTRVMRNDFLIRALRSPDKNQEVSDESLTEGMRRHILEAVLADAEGPRNLRSPDFLARAMRYSGPEFLARAMRSPNAYLVRTMRKR